MIMRLLPAAVTALTLLVSSGCAGFSYEVTDETIIPSGPAGTPIDTLPGAEELMRVDLTHLYVNM